MEKYNLKYTKEAERKHCLFVDRNMTFGSAFGFGNNHRLTLLKSFYFSVPWFPFVEMGVLVL